MTKALFEEDPKHVYNDVILKNLPLDPKALNIASPVPNSEKPGYSAIYRNNYSHDELIDSFYPAMDTLLKVFDSAAQVWADSPCLGYRTVKPDGSFGDYIFQDYKTIQQRRNNFGSGIFQVLQTSQFRLDNEVHSNLDYDRERKDGSFILTIFSHNRPEWALCDLTSIAYSIPNTALYDSLGPDTSKYILGLTESPIVICSKEKVAKLIELKKDNPEELQNLIVIVSMDDLSETDHNLVKSAHETKINLYDMKNVERIGEIYAKPPIPPKPETVFTITFTSGTTGNPKGVVLTHRNAVCAMTFRMSASRADVHSTHYSFLPLAHIFERSNIQYALSTGSKVGFPQGKLPTTLLEDVKILQPTGLALVPRVLTRLEAAIKAQTINNSDKPLLQAIFTRAINEKMRLHSLPENEHTNPSHWVYDRVLGLLKKKLGFANVNTIATGSSPISSETLKFLKASLNVGVSNGYGSSESFAGILSSSRFDVNPGSVGAIGVTTEVRVRDIPEMNYTSKDEGGPKGEMMLRGPQIFSEYFKNPEETAKAFDSDGWFHTGDVIRIDALDNNKIYIIDRVKNFFKLAQGEYVTPERIENTYLSQFPFISQLFVHGDSLQSYLVGVVGLDPSTITQYISRRFKDQIQDQKDLLSFINQPKNKKIFLSDMNASISNQLQGFEKLHNIKIEFEPLTVDLDLITPTQKIKRPNCKRYFQSTIEQLYEEGSIIKDQKL